MKAVAKVVDATPLISPDILQLTEWIADYYVCHRGVVLETVVPAGVRTQAGTRKVTYLSPAERSEHALAADGLPPKQRRALQILCDARDPMTVSDLAQRAECTTAPINALRKKGLVRSESRREFQQVWEESPSVRQSPLQLNEGQQAALDVIMKAIEHAQHQTILIHGVTGSGKTEVYIRAIEEVIGFGRQAIVLVPEISLTPQTRRRFRARFSRVAVLHSNLNPAQRHAEWQRIAQGDVQVVVGARSAVFAPLPNLGLVVIDEEHEASFKQDTVPRYHARDIAIRRTQQLGVPLILGSATPALESWHAATCGDYHLVQMPHRVMQRPMPVVGTIDMRDEFARKNDGFGTVSGPLAKQIARSMAQNGQVILLLNRRGFATHVQCPACGEVVRCRDCDIAMTHHRDIERLVCHYCNAQQPAPHQCPACRFEGIRFGGTGTQRLEDMVRKKFPRKRILRMDTDTMRRPGSHEAALEEFRQGNVDILVGTQMIAKGLDFPNVTLVGVVNADVALHLPDFRASERTFQLVTQVAGRTGRGERAGTVLVQTFNPEHPAIKAATAHAYETFAAQELPQREQFFYPPFSRLVRLVFRGASESATLDTADSVVERLQQQLESEPHCRVLGPVPAPISRMRGKFRFHVLIQIAKLDRVRAVLREIQVTLKPPNDVQWIIDVDPLAML